MKAIKQMNTSQQRGYTLIELLVAAALGILLLGIVITIYLGSKSTYTAAEGVGRSQEATRFAMHFLKRDIRISGYQGCSQGISRRTTMNDKEDSYPPSEENAIFGWEFNGTGSGDDYALAYDELDSPFTQANLDTARGNNTAGAGSWSGNYVAEVPDDPANPDITVRNLPADIQALSPLRGSDILAVTSSELINDIRVSLQTNQGSPTLSTVDINGDPAASSIDAGTIVKIGDCSASDTFQNAAGATDQILSAAPGAGPPGNKLTGAFKWQKKWDENASIYRSTTKIYFVGTGSGGKPSLFVYESSCGIGGDCATTNELVEGVENMQISYGEDTRVDNSILDQDPRDGFDGSVDVYRTANNVRDFREVRAVKVSLLVRSTDAGVDVADTPEFELLDQTTITPPNDRRQRFVNNTTVRIHNRGL